MKLIKPIPTILLASSITLAGCAGVTKSSQIDATQLGDDLIERKAEIYSGIDTSRPLSKGDIVALTIHRNLDIETKRLEESIEHGRQIPANLALLPKLALNARREGRSNLLLTTSERLIPLDKELSDVDKSPTYSQEKWHTTADLSLKWEVLNFWRASIDARIQSNETYISQQNKERAAENVVRDAQAAYYLAAASSAIGKELNAESQSMQHTMDSVCGTAIGNKKAQIGANTILSTCGELLSANSAFESVASRLKEGHVKLAALISADPQRAINVVQPDMVDPGEIKVTAGRLTSIALHNRPELIIEEYRKNIALLEKQRAWVDVFPSLEFGFGRNRDSNSFLTNDEWTNSYVNFSWNILDKVIAAPYRADIANLKHALANNRQGALIVTTVTQVMLATELYNRERKRWINTTRERLIKTKKNQITQKKATTGSVALLTQHKDRADYLATRYREYSAYAQMQDALAKVYLSLGVPVLPHDSMATDVASLGGHYENYFSSIGLF